MYRLRWLLPAQPDRSLSNNRVATHPPSNQLLALQLLERRDSLYTSIVIACRCLNFGLQNTLEHDAPQGADLT